MFLVEILLPVAGADGQEVHAEVFARARQELVDRFGGVTAYFQAPATGLWKDNSGTTIRDDIVVFEVMVDKLDGNWWAAYKQRLRQRLHQAELVVRAHEIVCL
jgi:hypothetical protein